MEGAHPRPTTVVVCSGCSLRAPGASSVEGFFDGLLAGTQMTGAPRYPAGWLGLPPRAGVVADADRFDNDFFQLSIKQAEDMAAEIRLNLEVVHEALTDAGLDLETLRGSHRVGVYGGHCFSDELGINSRSDKQPKTGYELINGAHSMAANRVSFFYDFRGPSLVVDTACSSSLVALHLALRDLEAGDVDAAVVFGLSLTPDPNKTSVFAAAKMLSPDGICYSFDERAHGYCRSEAAVAVVLERAAPAGSTTGLANALPRAGALAPRFLVMASAVTSDGHTAKGITQPSSDAQARAMRTALARAGASPGDVAFVEAHGTGTKVGDAAELAGLEDVFFGGSDKRDAPLLLGSVKSAVGHAEGASGLLSLLKVGLMMEREVVLPNQHFERSPHASILGGRVRVPSRPEPYPAALSPGRGRLGVVNNFGFGGTNAAAVLAPRRP